jgi:hypothetical protein
MSENFVLSLIIVLLITSLIFFKKLRTSPYCTCPKTSELLFLEETLISKGEYLAIQFRVVDGNRVDGFVETWLDVNGHLSSKQIMDPSKICVLKEFHLEELPEDGHSSCDHPIYMVREIVEVHKNERDSSISRNYEQIKLESSTVQYETFVVPFEEDTIVS